MLSSLEFTQLIQTSPLVSIDLIIQNEQGYLLGKRKNEPARGFWFVPGGRILKNEKIEQAFQRIAFKETGLVAAIKDAEFLGYFEHFYPNSFVADNISTHYVVLGFSLRLNFSLDRLPLLEHSEYGVFARHEIESNDLVHANTRQYFLTKGET